MQGRVASCRRVASPMRRSPVLAVVPSWSSHSLDHAVLAAGSRRMLGGPPQRQCYRVGAHSRWLLQGASVPDHAVLAAGSRRLVRGAPQRQRL
ncbi:hypothetical protein NDU88_005043 [Pleurodeles waltl]|uniref:Uncharacterized protein n=1 Tax=Pleurodeles waltl TaxID=8319 RepID=A0AAV7RL41_PLEWA|nr:hypothetical protein NDU88_005043 [Pleurodeles waltl]